MKRSKREVKDLADWGNAQPELLQRAITLITQDHDAVMLGLTSDGGAYVFNIYHKGEASKEYIPGNEDIDQFLTGVIRDYEP
jgi:glycosyltransferase A (GT-A) superfamily protein (DUF2064 family)